MIQEIDIYFLKLCVNCKFVATNGMREPQTYKCFSPKNSFRINLVTGDKEYETPYCASHRAIDTNGQLSDKFCTVGGYWFEQAPSKPQTNPNELKTKVESMQPRSPKQQLTADDL